MNLEERIVAIRRAEEGMARGIGLGYLTTRPISLAAAFIPGKFIIDFLRRGAEIRWASDRYLPPREDALAIARCRIGGGTGPEGGTEDEPRARLVRRLADHYEALLRAGGASLPDWIREAYPGAGAYEAVLEEIERAEQDLDQKALAAAGGEGRLAARLAGHREQARRQRRRSVKEIYFGE